MAKCGMHPLQTNRRQIIDNIPHARRFAPKRIIFALKHNSIHNFSCGAQNLGAGYLMVFQGRNHRCCSAGVFDIQRFRIPRWNMRDIVAKAFRRNDCGCNADCQTPMVL